MNIFLNNQIRRNQTLLDIMFGRKVQNTKTNKNMQSGRRDTVTISSEAQELSMKKSISGRTRNTSVDSTIDLQKYIDDARESNRAALENAGSEIDVNAVTYTDSSEAFRAALTDKYSKLAAEAKTHSNPEEYIYGKYYDKGSQYYEANLTETERRIAYNYEMQMYKDGKINGVSYQDSLFRGIEIYGDVKDNDRIMFKRQTINRQISNILSGAGIDTAGIPDTCSFTVDPYSYYISVDGVDDSLKQPMEQALNQGSNGKNLYKHILTCSTQDGCNSSQVSADSKLKFQAFQQVYEYIGLKLNELDERGGTYYTKDGEDIKELVRTAVDKSGTVPCDYKAQVKQWICGMISEISGKGWNNVADMNLSILFQSGRLIDTKQSIVYAQDSEWIKDTIGSSWYSVTNK
ncbi:DUF4885 domain-containing protein [Acetatifactor muris]|uniref:DUF4885 domain-containing protein n=1 Tax=Acetatifactor muris TaxID=879566 RepID=A0A2K4ZFK1_9FIRM|nr:MULTISPECIES: DUF4885 family protein [Acetatifactor]MCR2047776.1 DUF4885 domain-containing protein [Acetatifactor muris]SOY29216.1 hypothetical protein AMURIS_01931 [Acetatifactor muris]